MYKARNETSNRELAHQTPENMLNQQNIIVQPVIKLIHLLADIPHVSADVFKNLTGSQELLP